MYSRRRAVACLLFVGLAVQVAYPVPPVPADGGQNQTDTPPAILRIRVLEGEGSIHTAGTKSSQAIVIVLSDEAGRPVEGASVSLRFPDEAPTGLFANGMRTEIALTGPDGRVSIRGMQWARTAGPVQLRITANKGEARAGHSVHAVHNGTFGRTDAARSGSGRRPATAGLANRSAFAIEMDFGGGAHRRSSGGRGGGRRSQRKFGAGRTPAGWACGGHAAGGDDRQSNNFGGQAMKRILLVVSAILSAQQAIDAPPLAHVLDDGGRLTPIHGLAGNFIAGRPGIALLAYSNDGDIEWRLEAGRLWATRGEATAVYATTATRAIFRGTAAVLPESNEFLNFDGSVIHPSSEESNAHLAGRRILWTAGKLRIFQADGALQEIECPSEPERMTAAAAHWAHLVVNQRPYLLRLTPGRVELFVLPERGRE